MGIIKRADLESYTRDAVAMDLGDLKRRGDAVVQASQEQAAQILKNANKERDDLVNGAAEIGTAKGYEVGHADGLAQGIETGTNEARQAHGDELSALITRWSEALDSWDAERKDLMLAARTEVIELAAHIASRVIKRVIDLDPEVVVDQLEAVLDTLVTPTDIRVRVHPSDTDLLERVMPAMIERCSACNHAELVPDDTLAQGSCVVATKGGGGIDASISKQLDRVVATLLPAHRGPQYDQHLDEATDSGASTPDTDSKDDAA